MSSWYVYSRALGSRARAADAVASETLLYASGNTREVLASPWSPPPRLQQVSAEAVAADVHVDRGGGQVGPHPWREGWHEVPDGIPRLDTIELIVGVRYVVAGLDCVAAGVEVQKNAAVHDLCALSGSERMLHAPQCSSNPLAEGPGYGL